MQQCLLVRFPPGAQAIISGDADLHALGSYQGIPILSPTAALALVSKA